MTSTSMNLMELIRKSRDDGADMDFLREGIRTLAQAMMEADVTAQIGAARHERAPEQRVTHRNGYRERQWDTRAGTVDLAIPKLRSGSYFPDFLLEPRELPSPGGRARQGSRPGATYYLSRDEVSIRAAAQVSATDRPSGLWSPAESGGLNRAPTHDRLVMTRFETSARHRPARVDTSHWVDDWPTPAASASQDHMMAQRRVEESRGWAGESSRGAASEARRRRIIDLMTVGDRGWSALVIGATLLAAWLLAWWSGESAAVSRHWFYIPVVLAAVRLGPGWTLVVAIVAGVVAGPLVPLPGIGVGLFDHGQWLVRTGFFAAIGVLVAVLTESFKRYQQDQVELATQAQQVAARERHLAIQRAVLIQTVSHELRTPLTIIDGTVATWARLKDHITPAEAAKLIPPMQRATRRLESLVSTVLAAADAQGDDDLTPVGVSMSEILDRARRRIISPQARARVEMVSFGDPTVTTVPAYVETALGLVLDNALRFSPDDQPVTVTARAPRDRLEIEVRDHGPGIDPAGVEQLFEPFTQADQSNTRTHAGLGLGLYTSQKLIRRLGGEIELDPHPDGGTLARITVPSILPDR